MQKLLDSLSINPKRPGVVGVVDYTGKEVEELQHKLDVLGVKHKHVTETASGILPGRGVLILNGVN